jgi:hypothetical protein
LQKRNTKLAIRIKNLSFSPDGTNFAVATTEGLLIYSLANSDDGIFNPYFDENDSEQSPVTIDAII